MIRETNGDLLKSSSDIICHQVNCVGVMGAGVAKQIKEQLLSKEHFDEYVRYCEDGCSKENPILGTILYQKEGDKVIAHLFGEDIPTGCGLDTDYQALGRCLSNVEKYASENGLTVALPGSIGCGLAGGDWDYVYGQIIVPIFGESDVDLTIVYWP